MEHLKWRNLLADSEVWNRIGTQMSTINVNHKQFMALFVETKISNYLPWVILILTKHIRHKEILVKNVVFKLDAALRHVR